LGKPEGKRVLGKPRRTWEDNIGLHRDRIGWCGLDSSESGYGPVEGYCQHGPELSGILEKVQNWWLLKKA
jgi:hypothetical protein